VLRLKEIPSRMRSSPKDFEILLTESIRSNLFRIEKPGAAALG
jgi:hypothetical protein